MNIRISRDFMLMSMASIAARRSTCNRLHVGAIISINGRVLTTGYNGAPSKLDHCDHTNGGECLDAVHAEANAIAFAARFGVAVEDAVLHVTHSPCIKCSHLIINAGLSEVVYAEAYRISDGIALMSKTGIIVRKFDVELEDL